MFGRKNRAGQKRRGIFIFFPKREEDPFKGERRRDLSCFLKKTPLNAERGGAFFERFPAKKELAGGTKKEGARVFKKGPADVREERKSEKGKFCVFEKRREC